MERRGDASGGIPAARRGLWRLMLKLPAIRGWLQILAAKSSALDEVFEAYDEACATLERMQHETTAPAHIDEYQTICLEIEADVIRYILERQNEPD